MSIESDADLTWDVYIQCDYPKCPNGDTFYNVSPENTEDDYGKWDAQEKAIAEFEKEGWKVVRSEHDIPSERKHYCPGHATGAEGAEMSDWRNMDTAPKDGTKVDLYAKFWQAHRDDFIHQRFTDCYWTQGDSMTSHNPRWVGLGKEWCPIAWMPPDPPTRIPKAQSELPQPEDLRGLYKDTTP